jgi:hypothetical protein
MKKDNVIELVQPGEFKDQLTEVLRQGAQAVEAEFAAFLEDHADEKLEDGRRRIVRHGHFVALYRIIKSTMLPFLICIFISHKNFFLEISIPMVILSII